jgi:phage tail-like protein
LHALLRDRRRWQATLTGLVADEDGVLAPASVPALAEVVSLPGPFAVAPSGLAAAACCGLFVADARADVVWYRDGFCQATARLPGADCADAPTFVAPAGLALDRHHLAVADPGAKRVLMFALPDLRLTRVVNPGFQSPVAIAFDSRGRLLVLDRGLHRILRFDARGAIDGAFTALIAASGVDPRGFAVEADDGVLVTDAASDDVLRFDESGAPQGTAFDAATPWQPDAIARLGTRVFVADRLSGAIRVFDDGIEVGAVGGYVGPVSALAVGEEGTLYIKPADDDTVYTTCATLGHATQAELLAGPLDAGERDGWERLAIAVTTPGASRVELAAYFADTDAPPAPNDWLPAPAHDALLIHYLSPSLPVPLPPQRRYLWVRVRLRAIGADVPTLAQVHAVTADEDYREHLPALYAESDADDTLKHLLALARSEIGDGEAALGALPQSLSPQFARADMLPWLARWLAFDLPEGLDIDARRDVLARVWDLYRRRGTVAGLIEFIHLYTGIKTRVVEWFRQRHVWSLGGAPLGFATALPTAAADGMVVPDSTILDKSDPAWGCAVPGRVVAGHVVVGVDRPLARGDLGSVLFDDDAHRLSILVPAGAAREAALRARLREIVEAEAPAHVLIEICFIEPRLRLGVQSRIGIDAVVAGPTGPMRLGDAALNADSRLSGDTPRGAGIGQGVRIGRDLVLG